MTKGGGGLLVLSMYCVPLPPPHTHTLLRYFLLGFYSLLELSFEITSELLQKGRIALYNSSFLSEKKLIFFFRGVYFGINLINNDFIKQGPGVYKVLPTPIFFNLISFPKYRGTCA